MRLPMNLGRCFRARGMAKTKYLPGCLVNPTPVVFDTVFALHFQIRGVRLRHFLQANASRDFVNVHVCRHIVSGLSPMYCAKFGRLLHAKLGRQPRITPISRTGLMEAAVVPMPKPSEGGFGCFALDAVARLPLQFYFNATGCLACSRSFSKRGSPRSGSQNGSNFN